MSKLLKLSFSLVLALLSGALLTACVPQTDNSPAHYYDRGDPTPLQALVFANEAAVSAFSYNFVNYKKHFQTLSPYFTPQGWAEFVKVLRATSHVEAVVKKKLVVSAVATGSPVILEQGMKEGRYTWVIQMPLLITYQSAYQMARQNVIVKLNVVKTPPNIGTRGLGVNTFVVQSF